LLSKMKKTPGSGRAGNGADEERVAQAKKEIDTMLGQIKAMLAEKNDAELQEFAKATPELSKLKISCRRQLRGHLAKVYAMHWSEDKTHLVSASQDGKLLVWDGLSTNKAYAVPLKSSWVMTCAYAPNGGFVACGGLDNVCTVFNLRSREQPIRYYRELNFHTGYVSCCRFVNDRQILTSSGDATCILWDIENQTRLQQFTDHLQDVMSLSIAPDKNSFISGSCDRTAKLWDIRTGKCVQSFYPPPPTRQVSADLNTVTFFPNGQAFCTGSDDSSVRLFDVRADRELACYQRPDMPWPCTSTAFSASGRLLFAAYDNAACHVWDTLKLERVASLSGHEGRVSCVGVSPDGMALCTGSWDWMLRIWA